LLLEKDPKIRVIGEACDGKEAADLTSKLKPDLVLLDLRMPRCSGMEALKLIQHLSLPVRILILATEVQKKEIVEALRYGASGIVLKETATRLLRKSIDTVRAGQYWIEREGVSDSARVLAKRPRVVSREGSNKSWRLTPREEQIAAEVVSGKTNNEIAQTLGLSAQTVKHHLTSIFDKVVVYNRLELTLFCINYSFTNSGNLPGVGPDTAAPQDRICTPRVVSDLATPNPSEPFRFTAADGDIRERAVSPQTARGPASTGGKRFSSRSMR
jgi:DNA-binding NarL/FixJ family response regulator